MPFGRAAAVKYLVCGRNIVQEKMSFPKCQRTVAFEALNIRGACPRDEIKSGRHCDHEQGNGGVQSRFSGDCLLYCWQRRGLPMAQQCLDDVLRSLPLGQFFKRLGVVKQFDGHD